MWVLNAVLILSKLQLSLVTCKSSVGRAARKLEQKSKKTAIFERTRCEQERVLQLFGNRNVNENGNGQQLQEREEPKNGNTVLGNEHKIEERERSFRFLFSYFNFFSLKLKLIGWYLFVSIYSNFLAVNIITWLMAVFKFLYCFPPNSFM